VPLSQLDATNLMIDRAQTILKITPDEFRNGSFQQNPAFRFVSEQMAYDGANGFDVPSALYIKQASSDIEYVLQILLITFGLVCGLLLAFALFVFRPLLKSMVHEVTEYQRKVMEIILAIPRNDCSSILAKLVALENLNSVNQEGEVDDEDENEYSAGNYGQKSSGESTSDSQRYMCKCLIVVCFLSKKSSRSLMVKIT
jgi:hypothetical protein